MTIKLCDIKGCPFFGRYCRLHLKPLPKNQITIVKTVISKVAPQRKETNKEYAKRYKKEKGIKTKCEIKIPGVCTGIIQGYNHPAGKHSKKLLLNLANGQFCCNACNTWIEDHPTEAMALGYLKKRNTAVKKFSHLNK